LALGASPARADTGADRPGANTPDASAPALPLSIWRPAPGGAVENVQTGLICPAGLRDYRRTQAEMFDHFGADIGCNYRSATGDITVYLTRRDGPSLADAMGEAQRELLQVQAANNVQLMSDAPVRMGDMDWREALYSEKGDLRTAIWITDLGGWTLEYRATYPAATEARIPEDLEAVTAMVRASAGVRLSQCAKSQPPTRAGVAVTDQDKLGAAAMMSSLLGGAALVAKSKGEGQAAPPPIWCVERIIAGDHPMLYWRAIKADGADGLVDKVSLMTAHAPPTLVVRPEDFVSVLAEGGGDKPVRWSATLDHDGRVLIFGYFEGRPTPEAMIALMDQIIAGAAKPVGSYGVDGKSISIGMPGK
jgi:hypothetical protein